MNQRKHWILAGIFFLLLSSPVWALHPFYEENGDAYLLIGDGPQRGVYSLHNLTGAGVTRLYDPLDAYGITAEQVWVSGASNKRLYTFGADPETGWTAVTGQLSRNVILNATNNVYGPGVIPPLIVHRYHGSPFNSPTGRGNHPQGTLNWKFGGFDYPCSQVPPADPAVPGNSLVNVGRFYHSFNDPVLSPYVYGGYQANIWCHWVLRENVEACYRNMKLYRFLVNTMSGPSILQNIANVKTRQRSSMDKRGECVDGCITAADNIPLPGGETPYLDCVYSTLGRSYLYQREPSQAAYTLTGFSGTDVLIGNPNNLTTQYVGISSKDTTGNWVYTLGKDQINAWLAAANAPFTIASLSDTAVSDQWWQTGGLVYAYDRTQKKVYQFARNEVSGAIALPTSISVWDGQSVPDSISADGFGNLFMVRTDFEPDGNPPTFVANDAYSYTNTWMSNYRANFRQYVYKAVTRRDYYSGAFSTIPGRVLLGINEFFRDFTTPTPANRASWTWIGALTRSGPIVQTEYRTELSVLNNATPPKVTGARTGVVDIYGPLDNNLNMVLGSGPGNNEYDDTQTYFFAVENFPSADTNGVNIGSTGIDKDTDTIIGEFPSTTKIPSVKYYWKIIQTKDRYGVTVTNTILDQESTGAFSTSPILPVTLAGGQYRIGVKTKFRFYDYDLLPLGALSDQKETVLTAEITGTAPGSPDQYSWMDFIVRTVPLVTFPGGRGVIMSGLPIAPPTTPVLYSPTDLRAFRFRPSTPFDATNTAGLPQVSTADQNPVGAKFVVPELGSVNGRWAIQLRESTYNHNRTGDPNRDRLEVMLRTNPPDPADPRMVPGTLMWMGAPAFNWTCTLKRGVEGISDKSVTTTVPYFFYDKFKELMPVPSQPRSYNLQVRGVRVYQYDTYTPISFWVGGEIVTNWIRITKPITIQIAADAEFVMTDETGPALTFPDPFTPATTVPGFIYETSILWGSTGETLALAEGRTNPGWIEFAVADNNPMGNDPGDATINAFVDRFHAIAVNHVPSRRIGRFSYTTANRGNIPTATAPASLTTPSMAALAAFYSSYDQALVNLWPTRGWPGGISATNFKVTSRDLVEADFNGGWLATWRPRYNKTLSYRLYRIQRDDLQHFSFTTTGVDSPEMDLAFANSSPGYTNRLFGLEWAESSGYAINPQRIGSIVIRDNDRPNIFVRAQELKNEGTTYYAPNNVVNTAAAFGAWTRFAYSPTTEFLHNGVLGWDVPSIQGFDPAFHFNTLPITNQLTATAEIEVDVPVFFFPSILDNAGGIATLAFRLLDIDGSTPLFDATASGKVIRHIFRKPGVYTLRVQAEDLALGWPTDPLNPVTTATMSRNRRNMECKIKVVATRLDVRVIDRSYQGK